MDQLAPPLKVSSTVLVPNEVGGVIQATAVLLSHAAATDSEPAYLHFMSEANPAMKFSPVMTVFEPPAAGPLKMLYRRGYKRRSYKRRCYREDVSREAVVREVREEVVIR